MSLIYPHVHTQKPRSDKVIPKLAQCSLMRHNRCQAQWKIIATNKKYEQGIIIYMIGYDP